MADCCVDVVVDGVSAVDHQAVHKLHGLGPLTPQLAGHHDLAALSAALHDEPQNTIASPDRGEGEGQRLHIQPVTKGCPEPHNYITYCMKDEFKLCLNAKN